MDRLEELDIASELKALSLSAETVARELGSESLYPQVRRSDMSVNMQKFCTGRLIPVLETITFRCRDIAKRIEDGDRWGNDEDDDEEDDSQDTRQVTAATDTEEATSESISEPEETMTEQETVDA